VALSKPWPAIGQEPGLFIGYRGIEMGAEQQVDGQFIPVLPAFIEIAVNELAETGMLRGQYIMEMNGRFRHTGYHIPRPGGAVVEMELVIIITVGFLCMYKQGPGQLLLFGAAEIEHLLGYVALLGLVFFHKVGIRPYRHGVAHNAAGELQVEIRIGIIECAIIEYHVGIPGAVYQTAACMAEDREQLISRLQVTRLMRRPQESGGVWETAARAIKR